MLKTQKKRGRPPKKSLTYDDSQIIAIKKNLIVCFNISYDEYMNYKNNSIQENINTPIQTNSIIDNNDSDTFSLSQSITPNIKNENNNVSVLITLDSSITNSVLKTDSNVAIEKINNPFETQDNIIIQQTTNLRCLWDHCKIKGKPYFLPIKYNNGVFYTQSWFCSLNCACAYNLNLNDNNISERFSLLKFMYNYFDNIIPAPSILQIDKYGGELSIEEYRKKYCTIKSNENKKTEFYDKYNN